VAGRFGCPGAHAARLVLDASRPRPERRSPTRLIAGSRRGDEADRDVTLTRVPFSTRRIRSPNSQKLKGIRVPKSESPKSERSPNSEIRNHSRARENRREASGHTAVIRSSAFGFLSAFVLRPSDFTPPHTPPTVTGNLKLSTRNLKLPFRWGKRPREPHLGAPSSRRQVAWPLPPRRRDASAPDRDAFHPRPFSTC